MIYHSPTRQRNCGGSTKAFQCSTPHCTAAQYRWGKQGSEIADREGKPFFFFFCLSISSRQQPSFSALRNGSLYNDWQQRNVREEFSKWCKDELSGQQSVAWFPELERVLSSENTGAFNFPWLPWVNTAWPVSRILHHNDGQTWQIPPEFASQLDLPEGGVWEGPFALTMLTWWESPPLPFSDMGIPWTQKLENIKMQTDFFSLFPLFRKCIVTNSDYKMEQG